MRFRGYVIPLSDLKINPGRGVAVVQDLAGFEESEEERAFMRAVVKGLTDLEEGRELSLAEARDRLGLD